MIRLHRSYVCVLLVSGGLTAASLASAQPGPAVTKPAAVKKASPASAEETTFVPGSVAADPEPAAPAPPEAAVAESPAEVAVEAGSKKSETKTKAKKAQKAKRKKVAVKKPKDSPPAKESSPLVARYYIGLVVDTVWNKDGAYDFFSEDDIAQRTGLDLMLDVFERDSLLVAVEAHYAGGGTHAESPLGQYVEEASLSHNDFGLGVSARYHVLDWFAPHVRLSAGASVVEADVTGADFASVSVESTEPYGTLGVGFSLFSPKKRLSHTKKSFNSLSAVLLVDAGLFATTALDFEIAGESAAGAGDQEGRNVRLESIALGDLDRTGPYLRVGALAHF